MISSMLAAHIWPSASYKSPSSEPGLEASQQLSRAGQNVTIIEQASVLGEVSLGSSGTMPRC